MNTGDKTEPEPGKIIASEYLENLLDGFRVQENLFEVAIESTIKSLKESAKKLEIKFEEALRELPPEYENFDMDGNRTYRFRALTRLHNQEAWEAEQLLSLNEMRVIYLFKNLEVLLKSLIKTAYPWADVKDFYKWDNIFIFFKQREIDIKRVNGYEETNQLRIVNNNLKHSFYIDSEVKNIIEFKGMEFFDYQSLELFLERITSRVKLFKINLGQEVRKDLYEFDEDRLRNMALVYFKRLSKPQAQMFVAKIQEMYK